MDTPSFGRIIEFDEANQTGIIEQYDGSRAIFHVTDLVPVSEDKIIPHIGQNVLFRPDKNESGSIQAFEIQIVG